MLNECNISFLGEDRYIFHAVGYEAVQALAGAGAFAVSIEAAEQAAEMALDIIQRNRPLASPVFNALPIIVLAYSCWLEQRQELNKSDPEMLWENQEFSAGRATFRDYLAAWLWSWAPRHRVTPAEYEAVHAAVGVAPMPNPLMPGGSYLFKTEISRTTEVEANPAQWNLSGSLHHCEIPIKDIPSSMTGFLER